MLHFTRGVYHLKEEEILSKSCPGARLGSELDRNEPNCIELGAIQNRVETCRTDPVPIHFGHTSSAWPAGVVLPLWRSRGSGGGATREGVVRKTHRFGHLHLHLCLSLQRPHQPESGSPTPDARRGPSASRERRLAALPLHVHLQRCQPPAVPSCCWLHMTGLGRRRALARLLH